MENLRDAQLIMQKILDNVDDICRRNNIEYWLSDGTLLGAIRHKGFIPWDDDLDISMKREDYEKFLKVAEKELSDEFFLQTIETDKFYDVYGVPSKIRYKNSKIVEFGFENKKFNKGIFIDIFPMDKIPLNKKKYKILKNISFFFMQIKTDLKPWNSLRNIFRNSVKLIFKLINYKYLKKIIYVLFSKFDQFDNKYGYGIDTYFYEEYKESDLFPLREIEFEGKKYMAPNNPHNILKNLYGDYMKLPEKEKRVTHTYKIEIYK